MKASEKLAEVVAANMRFSAVVSRVLQQLGNTECLGCNVCCKFAPNNFFPDKPCVGPTNDEQRAQCHRALDNCPLLQEKIKALSDQATLSPES